MTKIVNSEVRKKILAARPRAMEAFFVDDWDVTLWLKELTLGERDAFEKAQIVRGEDGSVSMETMGLKARLIILCACDEDGNPIFTMEDEDLVNGLGAATTELVFAACQRVNKMRKEDLKSDAPLGGPRKNGSDSA